MSSLNPMFISSTFLNSIQSKLWLIKNPSLLLLLLLFNGAILLNLNAILWESYVMLFFVLNTLLLLYNHKIWWLYIVNILLSLYTLLPHFPRMANHCNIEVGLELLILTFVCIKFFNQKFHVSTSLLSYVFRIGLVTIYFYAGFHKLNTDFLNSSVSCVNDIHTRFIDNIFGIKTIVSANLSAVFQYATLAIEMIIPIGLLFYKTRKYAALFLIAFHFYLSLISFADFSGLGNFLILACCIDFNTFKVSKKLLIAAKIYTLFIIIALVFRSFEIQKSSTILEEYFVLGVFYNIGLVVLAFVFFRNYSPKKYDYKTKYSYVIIPLVLIISFWALKAYIGLGNSANLTMFSNLLTEKSRSNHLLLDTKKTKLFDFEEDNILFLQLDEKLKSNELEGFKIPMIEFNYLAKKWIDENQQPLYIKFKYKDEIIVLKDLKNSAYVYPKWWYKYIPFRKIQVNGPNECYW